MKYIAVFEGSVWGLGATVERALEDADAQVTDFGDPDLTADELELYPVTEAQAALIEAGHTAWPQDLLECDE